jgi:hypothetical protein
MCNSTRGDPPLSCVLWTQIQVSSGPKMDITDLTHSLAYGDTIAEAASFLCRDEHEVREKMKELGLDEHPGKRVRVVR